MLPPLFCACAHAGQHGGVGFAGQGRLCGRGRQAVPSTVADRGAGCWRSAEAALALV